MAKLSALDEAKKLYAQLTQRSPGPTEGQQKIIASAARGVQDFGKKTYQNVVKPLGQRLYDTTIMYGASNPLLSQADKQQALQPLQQRGLLNVNSKPIAPFSLTPKGYAQTSRAAIESYGLGKVNPSNVIATGAIGGTINKIFGGSFNEGATKGIGTLPASLGINNASSQILSPVTSRLGAVGGRLIGLTAGNLPQRSQQLLQSMGASSARVLGQGALNLGQDEAFTRLDQGRPQSTGERLFSFILGSGLEAKFGKPSQFELDNKGYLTNKAGRMFDPLSGKFVKASRFIQKRQEQLVGLMDASPTSDNPLGGMNLQPLAKSRLTQGGFLRLGRESGQLDRVPSIDSSIDTSLLKTLPEQQGRLSKMATNSTSDLSSRTNPLAESISQETSTYLKELEKSQNLARSTTKSNVKQSLSNFYGEFKRKLVDSNAPIEDLLTQSEKKGKFKVLPSQDIRLQIDRVLRAPTLAGQFAKDSGLVDVIKGAPDLHALDQYLIAKQATRVGELGKVTGRDSARDVRLIQELGPQYDQYAQKVTAYGRGLLDYAVKTGLVSAETASQLKQQYPDYVPLNRIFSEVEQKSGAFGSKAIASVSKQSVVQKLKGSEREIESPVASLLSKTQSAFEQGEKNIAAKQLASYKDLPGFKDILTELKAGESAPHTISFLDNGVKKTFATTPEIESAAKSLDKQQIGLIGQIFALPTRALRLGATGLNIGFTGANLAKDQVTNLVLSEKPLSTSIVNPANFVRSLLSAAKHDDLYQEVVRNGAGGTSFDIARNAPHLTVEELRSQRSRGSKIAFTIKNPGELLRSAENLIGRSEEFTRIQIYKGTKDALLKEGRTPQDAELLAAKAARETTTNFARSGEYGRVLSWMIPYFNAGVQGSRNLVRTLKQRPIQTSAQLAISVFTPIAAATAWNLSDPARKAVYDDLQDYEKEGNIIIIPPNATKDERGRWNILKIPLPQGISNLGSLVRRPLEQAHGLDPVRFKEVASNLLQAGTSLDVSSPNKLASSLIPQAIKPVVEGVSNTNLFTGNKIVPEYQKNLPPEEQVSPYTSGSARTLGKFTNMSPRLIENTVGTSFGGVGRQVLNASDRVQSKLGMIPPEQVGGQAFEDSISNRFRSAAGGKQEDLLQQKTSEQQVYRKKVMELIVQGKTDEAKKLRDSSGVIVTKGDLKRHISSQKTKAVDFVIDGDLETAKKIAKQYGIKISSEDVKKSAKRKAITYLKQGNKEEAKKLKDKFGFSLTKEDIN